MRTKVGFGGMLLLLGVGLAAGCCGSGLSGASKPIPLKDALAILQQDLRDVAPVKLSDVGSSGDGEARIVNEIGMEQCKQDTPNPLMPIVNGPLNLQLQGEFQVGGQVGFTVTAPVSVSAQAGIQRSEAQVISVPISFVSLASLPDFHFGQDMSNFSNLPESMKIEHAKELLKIREKIRKLTKTLMDAYPTMLKPRCAEISAGTLQSAQLIYPPQQQS